MLTRTKKLNQYNNEWQYLYYISIDAMLVTSYLGIMVYNDVNMWTN